MNKFIDLSSEDLEQATKFLHSINPKLKDKTVFGIEKHKNGDRSVVFHLIDNKDNNNTKNQKDTQLFILSTLYILERFFVENFFDNK
jgi:hypothetical protein